MLFSTRPKEDRKDLYDREKEIETIKDSIRRREWSAVLGIRRIGKTSIVNVATNEVGGIKVVINMMRLYDPRKKKYLKEDFLKLVLESVNEAIKKYTLGGRVVRFITNVLGIDEEAFINFNLVKIKPKLKRFREEDINYLFRELNDMAKDNGKTLLIVFDEAQELSKVNVDFTSIFHDIYEYCLNTVIIYTGSMVRILNNVLKDMQYREPFFGRYIRTIELPKFTPEQSKDFLLKGFEEEGIMVSEKVIEEALLKFDGIPGWLTHFGSEYSFAIKHGVKPDIESILEKAIEEVKEEVKNFIKYSQSPVRYSAIFLAIDRLGGRAKLHEVKKVASSIINDEVPEPRVYEMLNRLIDYGFIEKENDEYLLPKDEPSRIGIVKASMEVLGEY
ncbi:MAG: ATP-binding protein [Sulfolobaceae archaeon]|nr:ATP-binding protein [Sulfolobaceae archaeon]